MAKLIFFENFFLGILCVALAVLQCIVLRHEPVQLSFRLRHFTGVANFPSFFKHNIMHSLFISCLYWFCFSLRFSCQNFRTSVFVPRSPASNLKTIATNNRFSETVLMHEAEF